MRTLPSFLFSKRPAEDGRGSKQIEQAGRDRGGRHALGLAVTADCPLRRPDPFQPLEEAGPLAKPDELQRMQRIRMGKVGPAGRLREDPHEAFGVLEGKRPEQHRVGDEKHRASRPDDERERDDADRGEPAPGRERAKGESKRLRPLRGDGVKRREAAPPSRREWGWGPASFKNVAAGIHHDVPSCADFEGTVALRLFINNND